MSEVPQSGDEPRGSLHRHIANVLHQWWNKDYEISEAVADALLADPTLAAIYDLADWAVCRESWVGTPEVRALLANWRANRACTELTQEAQRLGLYDD